MEEVCGQSKSLPFDLLQCIFGLVSSHERRVNIPLVCKGWLHAVSPPLASPALWKEVEIRDSGCQERFPQTAGAELQEGAEVIRRWLFKRHGSISKLEVSLASVHNDNILARWCEEFGLALPVLGSSTSLKQLIIRGPGAIAADSGGVLAPSACCAAADVAGTLLHGAFSLTSLESLQLYDIPWVTSLHRFATSPPPPPLSSLGCCPSSPVSTIPPAPSSSPALAPFPSAGRLNLQYLSELTINRSFYNPDPRGQAAAVALLDGGAAEAWGALGQELAALPHLSRLDLAFTHAMSYCDPARGAAAAPWPPLKQLRELSLAHDLSVQPPPPPPPAVAAAGAGTLRSPKDGSEGDSGGSCRGSSTGTGAEDLGEDAGRRNQAESSDDGGRGAALEAAAPGVDCWATAFSGVNAAAGSGLGDEPYAGSGLGDEPYAEGAVDFAIMVTVDAAHAAVELLTWLPTCTALSSLDLRNCGLEAVPLAVVHLPVLARLDLYGNPLVTMRLPGPLVRLKWLRFSLDPCYDMLHDSLVEEAGEAAAAEDMLMVELPSPRLEELEVDSTSSRALGRIREAAAATLPHLRRLALIDNSAMALVV